MHTCCPPCKHGSLRVEIHTGTHLILGSVEVKSPRSVDLCAGLTAARLLVKDARVQPLRRAVGEPYRHEEQLTVSRDDIHLCIPYGCSGASGAGASAGMPPARTVPTTLHLTAVQVEGRVCLGEGQDTLGMVQDENDPFIVVYQTRIRYLDEAISLPFTAEVVLVNRDHVHLVAPQRDASQPASRLRKSLARPDAARVSAGHS